MEPKTLTAQQASDDAKKMLAARKIGRNTLLGFTRYTKDDFQVEWYHRLMCKVLDLLIAGKMGHLIITLPPRHGKSELVSRRMPAYILGQQPNAQVIAVSHTQDLANEFSDDVQGIMETDDYHQLFPGTVLPSQAGLYDVPRRRTDRQQQKKFTVLEHRGAYRCAGVNGSIVGKGFNYGIIDDPIKGRKDADSEAKRKEAIQFYRSAFYTRQEQFARMLITTTRWHESDPAGWVLDQAREIVEDGERWTVLWLPASMEEAVPKQYKPSKNITLIGPEFDKREPGDALWPWKFPKDRLKRIEQAVGSREWAAQYQSRPRPDEGQLFRQSMLKPAVRDDGYIKLPSGIQIDPKTCLRFNCVDLATSDKTSADWTVIGTFYGHPGSRSLIFIDMHRERLTGGQHKASIQAKRMKHKTQWSGVEKKFFGQELVQRMRRQSGEPMRELDYGTDDKVQRANAALPYMEQGDFYIIDTLPERDYAESELLGFPNVDFDDVVDVVVFGVLEWFNSVFVPEPPEDRKRRKPSAHEQKLRQVRPLKPR